MTTSKELNDLIAAADIAGIRAVAREKNQRGTATAVAMRAQVYLYRTCSTTCVRVHNSYIDCDAYHSPAMPRSGFVPLSDMSNDKY